ncbi:MAG: hypothetical protein AAGG38_09105, partial [Planctomycetota bacterium]
AVPGGASAVWGVGVVWLGSLLGLWPVATGGAKGALRGAQGFMWGQLIRMMFCLAGALVGVLQIGLMKRPFLISLAVVYLVLLGVEVWSVGRYFRRAYPDRPSAVSREASPPVSES